MVQQQDSGQFRPPPRKNFLPDFCNIRVVFSVVVIAEMLAFALTLATPGDEGGDWQELSLLSLFIQWIALSCAALLCMLRRGLRSLGTVASALSAYAVILSTTTLFSEVAYWGGRRLSSGIVIQISHHEFLARNLGISAIVAFLTLRYFYLRHQLRLNVEAEAQARLQALQARIRPHFLFNSLNTIASLIRRDAPAAEEAVEDLADMFRTALGGDGRMVTLEDELELSERYIHMEQLRLGERLNVQWEIDDIPADALLPALTLQPLLENAVYHGIETLNEGGTIRCHGELQRNTIVITISNPVTVSQGEQPRRQGHKVALDNIRQRLLAHFDDEGGINVDSEPDYYFVTIKFPYRTHEPNENINRG